MDQPPNTESGKAMANIQLHDKEPACLFNLPPELLNQIMEDSGLSGRYLFSETCRRARQLFGIDSAAWLRVFPSGDRLRRDPSAGMRDFLAAVAFARPHHTLCFDCVRIHRVCEDPPPREKTRRCDRHVPLYPRRPRLGLQFSHVESALKMARMLRAGAVGADEVRGYLRNLLMGVEEVPKVGFTKDLRYREVGVVSTPKTAEGMFILHTRIEIIGVRRGVGQRTVLCQQLTTKLRICEDLSGKRRRDEIYVGDNLQENLVAAFRRKGTEMKGSCGHCGLDYAIIANHGGLVVESWQNLGRYDCAVDAIPRSLFGLSYLSGTPLDVSSVYSDRRQGVGLLGGKRVYRHVSGDIRKAYKRG